MNWNRYFGDAAFRRMAVAIAVPIALQNLLTTSFALVDTLMVSALGETALAAVGQAAAWNQLFNVFLFGLTGGAGVFLAQYWGARDEKGIHRAYGLGLLCTLAVTVVFTLVTLIAPYGVMALFSDDGSVRTAGAAYLRIVALSYPALAVNMLAGVVLRSTERVKIPFYSSLASVGTNIVLNYLLIYGSFGFPRLELRGAAIASVAGNWVGLLVTFAFGVGQHTLLRVHPRALLDFDKGFAREYIRICVPVFLNESIWGIGTAVLSMIYGHMGTTEYAGLTIFRSVDNVLTTIFVALSAATGVLVGKEVGAGNREKAYQNALAITCWTPILSICLSVILVLLRQPIVAIFQQEAAVNQVALWLMIIAAFEMPIRFLPFVHIVGVFRAGADAKTAVLYDFIGVWCVSVPLALIGMLAGFPFLPVYAVVVFGDGVVKLLLSMRHFLSKKWIIQVTGRRN